MIQYDGDELEVLKEAKNYYLWLAQELEVFIRGKVIDVGAGLGTFSEHLLKLPIQNLVCIEPSSNLTSHLRSRFRNRPVRICGETLESFGLGNAELFDTVICINVLEHIEDDHQALIVINRLLRTGGKLCLFVPANQWLYGTLDENFGHYRRYSKSQLKELLTRSGFDVVKLKYFHFAGLFSWILMGKILHLKTWDPGSVKLYDQMMTPLLSRIERVLAPPLGQSLIAVGIKTDKRI